MSISVLSLVFANNEWSWGLIAKALHQQLGPEFNIEVKEAREWVTNQTTSDIILSQNITQFKWFKSFDNVVARLGGNMSFDDKNVLLGYFQSMSKCPCIIATNQKLKNIASTINSNVHLIPNGLDLTTWCPKSDRKWRIKRPVVGFVGNVGTPKHAAYKGYNFVKEACEVLRLPLQEALYKTKQIPHDQMKTQFWDTIDLLVLPTAGEGCSNTIMEALACGVPVITTRIAGFHGEKLVDKQSVIFCERSTESVVNAIQTLRADKTLFTTLANNGRLFAEQHHDITIIAAQYKQIILECYNDATARSNN